MAETDPHPPLLTHKLRPSQDSDNQCGLLPARRLTGQGQQMHEKAQELGASFHRRFASSLTDREAILMEDLLRKLERQAEAMNIGDSRIPTAQASNERSKAK